MAGIWISVLPYLGFPYGLKNILFTLSGFGIIYIGYMLYKENKKGLKKEGTLFENFSENTDFTGEDIGNN